jgi:predicted DNA-binding transcriptional regulator
MSLELVNTLGTLGTFLVIAATAIAAIVQLRHARSSNHIAALNELRETQETSDFQAATQFVAAQLSLKMQDPAFRYQLVVRAARTDQFRSILRMMATVENYYESIGVLVKTGLVERELVMQIWANHIISAWERLAPVVAIIRRELGPAGSENFEYLTVLAQDWMAAHPNGTYPAGVRRIELKDEWLEADKQYAASLAPA